MKSKTISGVLTVISLTIGLVIPLSAKSWMVLKNTARELTISVDFPGPETAHELDQMRFTVGLPSRSPPRITVNKLQTSPFQPSPDHPYSFDPPAGPVAWERLTRYRDLDIGILAVSPLVGHGPDRVAVGSVEFTLYFPPGPVLPRKVGRVEESLYRSRVVNWEIARLWVSPPRRAKRKSPSQLPAGGWYRIDIETDGVYQLTAPVLEAAGVNIQKLDPRSLSMFTNPRGGRPMSSEIGNELTENLVEVAIKTLRNNDGSFDEIVFYGRGPRGFDSSEPLGVSFTQNPYANVNTYWLSIPRDSTRLGKRVAVSDSTFDNPVLLDYAISHSYAEEDLENPFDSGLLWVGPGFTRNQTVSVVFDLHHPKRQVDSSVRLSVFGGTASESDDHPSHRVNIYQGSISGPLLDSRSWAGLSAKELSGDLDATRLVDGPNSIVFENASTDMASKIHLDWTMLTYGSELRWEDAALEFWAPPNVPAALFAIARANSEVTVWDITEFVNPVQQTVKLSGGVGYFETSLPQDRPGRFIAFTDQTAREVTVVVPDQDNSTSDLPFSQLRTTRYPVDHIIIAPEEFLGPAQKLSQHRTNSTVVLLKAIYDEFSGGVQDPLAIRYFLKWTKENWRNPADNSFPSFVLLFGDGDYDYRNITGNSHNRVLTFQSSQPKGVSSDDRFAYLDGNTPEMAIGRFPAVSLGDATNMTDKTIAYESDPEIGLWRRRVTLIADDFARPNFGRIELTHTKNSESVARMVPPSLELEKLYMEDFPQVNTGTQFGVTKPEATEALFDALERGTVLLNYIGHGSPYQWAQEGLLSAARGDLSSINTGMKLPIWMAATCSWGRYDNVEGSAMSEEILRLPDNGAIAIISTTGLITFSENRDFILSLFKSFFPNGRVTEERLGTVYHSIKDGSVGSQKFHLFGDPALKLALAPDTVTVKSVTPDTLVALETGTFSGSVGQRGPGEGEGYGVLYDADRTVTRMYEQDLFTEKVTYTLPGPTLFRGLIRLKKGKFQGHFILPKDVNYATSDGRLAVYLYGEPGGELWEGLGVREGLVFSGGTTNPVDSKGPLISFGLPDRGLQWGDHVPEDADLIIQISDPLGVNVTEEVGHAIRLWLDENESDAVDLTDKFVYAPQSYTSGSLTYSLNGLPEGESLVTVEAWDNANNASQGTIALTLSSSKELTLTNVLNYPNPFRDGTQFAFELNQEARVTIKVFTLSGQLVKELDPMDVFLGYSHIDWDGRDDFGDRIANGAYLYQVTAAPLQEGKKATVIGKIAKYR